MSFPANFTWGAATASYQIEGAVREGGRGPTIWDDFCHTPGRIFGDHTGDVACDHYHRLDEDIALMKRIGLKAYRFSIAWSRILPQGTGAVNTAGLDFYDRLVDGLLAADIAPWATLFHWDLPRALHDQGGWLNERSPEWFHDYAAAVATRLGDRVKDWMTFNEPQCTVALGLENGLHAPGHKLTRRELMRAWHNLHKAHGRGVQALRRHCTTQVRIGYAPTSRERIPVSGSKADLEAAQRAYWHDLRGNGFWSAALSADLVYLGKYPKEAFELWGPDMPDITDEDMRLISQPLDFIGYNCYSGEYVRSADNAQGFEIIPRTEGFPCGMLAWQGRMDDCIYWAAKMQTERYGKLPFVITENGTSSSDWVSLDGAVHDPQRIDFTTRYLSGMKRAAAEGIPVAGYFHWSLMDNLEWAEGYRPRFGLIHVDYPTQKRTLKDSALWYAEVIRTNGTNIP